MSSLEPSTENRETRLAMQRPSASSLTPFSWQSRPPSQQPAMVYVQSLGKGSQRTIQGALFSLVQLMLPDQELGEDAIVVFPWEQLRFEHTSVLRARLADRYKPSTANKHIAALRGVLKAAWQLELMTAEDYHKAANIKNVRGASLPVGRSLKEGELRVLLLTCQQDRTTKGCRDLALIALLFATGLRRQEITLLDYTDYDRETHALRVRGKGQKERLVYVEAPGAYEALHTWLLQRGEESGPLFVRIRRGGHLVRSVIITLGSPYYKEENGEPPLLTASLQRLTEQGIYAIVLERVEASGILPLTTHDFRRNFIGELLDNGVDLSTAQKLAGHASPTTTARYDRRPEATKKRAAGTLHVPVIRWQPRQSTE
jgi:site-specific recombinase XerD